MQRRYRLSRSRDFDAVYRQGKSVSSRFLILYWFERPEEHDHSPRVGIAIPRKVGSAVVRNRVKRRLREAWRTQLDRIPEGRDFVLVARPGLAESADTSGPDWVEEQVAEVLGKVAG